MDERGNLYGTTSDGGDFKAGTVFKLDTSGKETVLHSFNGKDGRSPEAGVFRDAKGNLYGATFLGGVNRDGGTVFKVDTTGKATVLHNFEGKKGGVKPSAGLVMDEARNLYGTTTLGGEYSTSCNAYSYPSRYCGTIFKITP